MIPIPSDDRLELLDLVARYAFRCDTGRYGEVAELFTPDGVFDETAIGVPLCTGREMIDATFRALGGSIAWLIHLNSNHQVTAYAGTTAGATAHLHVEGNVGGRAVRILGYYDDRYRRVEGRWLFERRRLVEIAPTTGMSAEETP
jgi:hypothetical protein